ncbi:unnamed protein product, partial [marine sediment metagenome]
VLFKVNIKCVQYQKNQNNVINDQGIIRYDDQKNFYPNGDDFSSEREGDNIPTITIVWVDRGLKSHYMSTRPLNTLHKYYYCKSTDRLVRDKYITENITFNKITVGHKFNDKTGKFTRIEKEENLINNFYTQNCKEIRYYQEGPEIRYNGFFIGICSDQIWGIIMDGQLDNIPAIAKTISDNGK